MKHIYAKTKTLALPAAWACALIKADFQGLSDKDQVELAQDLGPLAHCCVSVADNYVGTYKGLSREIADFVFFCGASV